MSLCSHHPFSSHTVRLPHDLISPIATYQCPRRRTTRKSLRLRKPRQLPLPPRTALLMGKQHGRSTSTSSLLRVGSSCAQYCFDRTEPQVNGDGSSDDDAPPPLAPGTRLRVLVVLSLFCASTGYCSCCRGRRLASVIIATEVRLLCHGLHFPNFSGRLGS